MALFENLKKNKSKQEQKPEETKPSAPSVEKNPGTKLVPLITLYQAYEPIANTDPVYGAKIPGLIKEYKAAFAKAGEDRAKVDEALSAVLNELVRTLLFVPVAYEKQFEFAGDTGIHFSMQAGLRFTVDSIVVRGGQMTVDQLSSRYWVFSNGVPTADMEWWDISRFSGSEGYHFAEQQNRMTYPMTVSAQNETFCVCFTGIDLLKKSLGADFSGHICVYTIGDLINMLKASPAYPGLIVNPGTDSHCFLGRQLFRMD